MTRKTEFTVDEIISKIDTSLKQTDQLRSDNLEKMAVAQQVNVKALEKERQRLSLKYGAEDERVQRLTEKLQFTQGFSRDLEVERDKANVQVPTVDRQTWVVHGRVLRQKDGQGMEGLTVALANAEGQWVRELGYACTDERGYFAIIYPLPNGQSTAPKESLFLMVSDRDRRVLYRSSEPLSIQPGQIIYREIFLSEQPGCQAPEEPETPTK